MLVKFENNKTGIIVDNIIIKPPIVGVPTFFFWPSKPRSRTVSPICFLIKKLIKFFPYLIDIYREIINANEDLNEIYWNRLAPINWNWFSKYSNKK